MAPCRSITRVKKQSKLDATRGIAKMVKDHVNVVAPRPGLVEAATGSSPW